MRNKYQKTFQKYIFIAIVSSKILYEKLIHKLPDGTGKTFPCEFY